MNMQLQRIAVKGESQLSPLYDADDSSINELGRRRRLRRIGLDPETLVERTVLKQETDQ